MRLASPTLTAGALTLVLCVTLATAEGPSLAPLIRTLDLVVYPPGTMPPSLSGRALDGEVSLAGLRGKVVIVNFWAAWCAECRPEMPALDRLHRELGPKGFAVLGVNAREDVATVRRYAKELNLSFPLVLDQPGVINAAYGVIGLPTSFVVARDGRAVAFGVGPREWSGAPARALIVALLAERSAPSRP